MNVSRINFAASIALTAVFSVAPGFALNLRSWVSGNGSDLNPCTVPAPCLTFQHAHDVTASGGEVDALTPGDYGLLKIDRPITIDGANMAYITGPLTLRGIDVEPAATGATVVIRNLSLNANNFAAVAGGNVTPANVGIYWGNGQILHIEDVAINGMYQGVQTQLSTTLTNPRLYLKAITVRNCALHGVNVFSGLADGSSIWVGVERALIEQNYNGMNLYNSRVSISRSNLTGNINGGIFADHSSEVNVEDTNISFSNVGIFSTAGSTVRIATNNIHDNTTGLFTSSASILSFGNNRIAGNAVGETPTGAVALK